MNKPLKTDIEHQKAEDQAPELYVCWTNNCRNHDDGLYVFHAYRDSGRRTLCGCEIQEVGAEIDADNQPSCKRCLAAMRKANPN